VIVRYTRRVPDVVNELLVTRILLSVEGEDADRLQHLAAARGQRPTDLVAERLRAADRPAA
jgi:hypothetical protein